MEIDLRHVPFSRFGSYFAVSYMPAGADVPAGADSPAGGLRLRSVHGGHDSYNGPSFRLDLLVDGMQVPYQHHADPLTVRMQAAGSPARSVRLCMPEPNQVRIAGEGAGLRLVFPPGIYDTLFPAGPATWQFNCASWDLNLVFTVLVGAWRINAPWQGTRTGHIVIDLLPDDAGRCEAVITEVDRVWNPAEYTPGFDESTRAPRASFEQWLAQTPTLPAKYAEARRLAAYITWSGVVEPAGHLNWPAMLMSKNWMNAVWSWDHCFNAMALIYGNPLLAWDQIQVVFDQQDMWGGLPDLINDRRMVQSFVKPPIHGWAIRWMMDRSNAIRQEQLHLIYGPLCRWTEWWFLYRDYDADGIPQYHHGNDSGWDNATPFDTGLPLESPDLSAFLVLQMDTLAEIAARLGSDEEAESWQRRADELLERMLAHFWQGDHFAALRSGDHLVSDTESLLLYLPLLLGRRLPHAVRRDLVAGLARPGRFLGPHGPATESFTSPRYTPDGYWRGPVWAPATLMIVEGLAAAGEPALAATVARQFCDTCAASGFAENFDARTGQGLRDRAYTWTASVFLILGHEYLGKEL